MLTVQPCDAAESVLLYTGGRSGKSGIGDWGGRLEPLGLAGPVRPHSVIGLMGRAFFGDWSLIMNVYKPCSQKCGKLL